MSIYVYAADKLPPFMRLISLFFVMLGAGIRRSYYISKYMDEYTSRIFNESRWICFNVDPWKAFFNPSFGTSAFHVVITAYATGAAVIASIAGFKLLKKNLSTREIAYHKRGYY